MSKSMAMLLSLSKTRITCKITRKGVNRGAGYSLEIHCIYKLCGDQKAISLAKKKIYMIMDKTRDSVRKCINNKQRK